MHMHDWTSTRERTPPPELPPYKSPTTSSSPRPPPLPPSHRISRVPKLRPITSDPSHITTFSANSPGSKLQL